MAKTTTAMNDDGRVVTCKLTQARRKSESRLIPWTPAPKNRRQKIMRALVG